MNNTVIALDLAKHLIQTAKFTQDAVMQFHHAMSPDESSHD